MLKSPEKTFKRVVHPDGSWSFIKCNPVQEQQEAIRKTDIKLPPINSVSQNSMCVSSSTASLKTASSTQSMKGLVLSKSSSLFSPAPSPVTTEKTWVTSKPSSMDMNDSDSDSDLSDDENALRF